LTEADLNALMIPTTRLPDRNTKDKNSRAQEQQRAIILTHEAAIKRRQEYLENRDRQGQIKAQDKKEREIKREEKKQKALEDRVAKEKLKKEKEDAKIAAQTEKKARKEEVEKAKEEKKLQSRGESTRAGVENRSKHKKNSQGKQTNSNNNNPLSSSLALNNGNDISLEGSQDVDWIFSMLEPGRGPFSDVATVSSKDVVKDLLAMRRALNPIHISVKNLKDPTFWDEVCYRVNLHNIPLAYIIPGEIQDPFSKLNKKMSDWIDMKTRETKDNKDTSVSIQVPAAKAKFPLPIPPPIAALLNHVTRTQIFAHTESQVLNHDSRVSRGHVDLGFGWLYLIEGVKYIFYVEEPLRTPGSSVHPIPGCSVRKAWDMDTLSTRSNVKYCRMIPGTIIFLPAPLKHIVMSPVDCKAYGGYTPHLYGAMGDLALYCDIQRETHEDMTLPKDNKPGTTPMDAKTLAIEILRLLEEGPDGACWSMERIKEIYHSKKDSYVSENRTLSEKLRKLCNMCK